MDHAGFGPCNIGGTAFPIPTCLKEIYDRYRFNDAGRIADYIPELAKADPNLFGIAMFTADGKLYEVGDVGTPFTIQSISKPFVYGLALADHGLDHVMRKCGVEPTGEAFNAIVLDEHNNRPFNPMVNAGAIAITALIKGEGGKHRFDRILQMFSRFAGRELDVDEAVFRSERETGHRNRAIAYLELNAGMIDEPVEEHLDLYFRQCSIRVTAHDLAIMAATLANHGINPLTREHVIEAQHVKNVLSVMSSCGMYDYSGEWIQRVGLPAKSGVAGGILAVLPGQVGLGVYSAPLDKQGNSVRGLQVYSDLSNRFNLHMFDAFATTRSSVRRVYSGGAVTSKRQRRAWERAVIDRKGPEIIVYELQGDLFFASMEQILRQLALDSEKLSFLILDGKRVGRADRAALVLINQTREMLASAGKPLLLAGFCDTIRSALQASQPSAWQDEMFLYSVDDALERCENRLILAADPCAVDVAEELPLARMDILIDFSPADIDYLSRLFERVEFTVGEVIIREGDPADRLFLLACGSAVVSVRLGNGVLSRRLAAFAPGVAFGELAVFNGGKRTADVIADTSAVCFSMTLEKLKELATDRPDLHHRLLIAVGRNLTDQLRRANAEIRALEE